MKIKAARRALLFSLLLLPVACNTGPQTATFYWKGDKVLNTNSKGSSTPLILRIYQLKESDKFVDANFDQLLSGEEVLEGSNVGAYTEAVITQDKESDEEIDVRKGVKFIGIVGLFSRTDPSGAWKQCVPVDEFEDWRFVFTKSVISKVDR